MKRVTYRNLQFLESGRVFDTRVFDAFSSLGRIVSRDGRYVVLNPYGNPYQFGSVGNSFVDPEEALKALFDHRYPELVERSLR